MDAWTPHPKIRGIDHWERTSWNQYVGWARWPEGFPQPRTCSFCGGIHPDDAVQLIELGWEVGVTDKPYKRYLEPPGSRAYIRQLISEVYDLITSPTGEIVSPIPPVKLYVWHFDDAQRERFNQALETNMEKARGE